MPKAEREPFVPQCMFTGKVPQALLFKAYETILRYEAEAQAAKGKGA